MSTCSLTEAESQTYQCPKCKVVKPLSDFPPSRRRIGCSACRLSPEARAAQHEKDCRPRNRYSRARAQAKNRGIYWDLPFEFFADLITKTCIYCDGPLEPTGAGMDRMHGSLGYTPENVVPCCSLCNTIKQRVYTYEEMLIIGKAVKAVRELRKARGLPPPTSQAYYFLRRKHEVRWAQEAMFTEVGK